MRYLIAACFLIIAVHTTAASAQTAATADEQAIRDLSTQFVLAWNKGDAKAIAALHTADYEAMGPGGTVTSGRAAYEQLSAKAFAARTGSVTMSVTTEFVTMLKPDVAIAGGTWSIAGGEGGPAKGAWTWTLVKRDGKWLAKSSLANTTPPAPGSD